MTELRVKSTGTLKLFESDNTSSVTIASPASLGGDRTVTLPDASVTLASGTMLATDGSGASLTALNASELGSGTVPTARLGTGTASSSTVLYGDQTYKAEPTGGKILQAVQAYINADVSTTNTTWTATTGFEVDITPSATSSKILILVSAGCEKSGTDNNFGGYTLYKDDSTNLGEASYGFGLESAEGGTSRGFLSLNWLDSPSTTSSVNYQVYMKNMSADSIKVGGGNASSVIIAMEVGA